MQERIATVRELREALSDLDDDAIVMVDGHLYIGPGSNYGQKEDSYECDECKQPITTGGFISDEHLDWCSGHPDNEVTKVNE